MNFCGKRESPVGARFTEDDIVSEVGIRTLAGCV
jgi:hypothetical protein